MLQAVGSPTLVRFVHSCPHMLMRTTVRPAVLALTASLLISNVATAQLSGLAGGFGGSYNYGNYVASGGGEAIRQGWTGAAAASGSYSRSQIGGTVQNGQGSGQASFGFLSAAASGQAYDTPGGWSSQSNFMTSVNWFDQLTIQTSGQLVFSLALSDRLALSSSPVRPDCYVYLGGLSSDRSGGNCALAGAQFEVNGDLANAARFQNTTGSLGVSAWPNQGPQVVNVFAGEVLPIAGYLRVSAGGCVANGYLVGCLDDGSPYASATGDAEASASFFVEEINGATYIANSGTVYAAAVVATPEPRSFLLLGAGLLALVGFARWGTSRTSGRCPGSRLELNC